jgi:hypothetical protein
MDTKEETGALSFETAFGPLAHHFHPDGCPVVVVVAATAAASGAATTDTVAQLSRHLSKVWPVAKNRAPVPAAAALQSIKRIRKYAEGYGLLGSELVAVAYVASTGLPPSKASDNHYHGVVNQTAAVVPQLSSPLRNGKTQHFCTLVECLLPRWSCTILDDGNGEEESLRNEDNVQDPPNHQNFAESSALQIVCQLLVSACCGSGQWRPPGVIAVDASELIKARRCVLRFLYLVIRWSRWFTMSSLSWWYSTEPGPATVRAAIYAWVRQQPEQPQPPVVPKCGADAMRVVWWLYQTARNSAQQNVIVPVHRVGQLRACWQQWEQKSQERPMTLDEQAVRDFVQMYDETRQPSSSAPFTRSRTTKRPWLDFPDPKWQHNFQRERSSTDLETHMTDGSSKRSSDTHRDRLWTKRSRLHPTRDLGSVIARVQTILDGDANDRDDGSHLQRMEVIVDSISVTRSIAVLLQDRCFQYIHANLSCHSHSMDHSATGTVLRTFDDVVQRQLSAEWNAAAPSGVGTTNEPDVVRVRILQSLLEFAQATHSLPDSAESFFLQDILSSWDGRCDDERGRTLLAIVPFVRPPPVGGSSDGRDGSFDEVRNNEGVGLMFVHLERVFLCGNDQQQFAISEALGGLVYRWRLLDWVEPSDQAMEGTENLETPWKWTLLQEICKWADNLFLQAYATSLEGSELLHAAVLQFYSTVYELGRQSILDCAVKFAMCTVPSPSMIGRLLLSPSVVHLNRLCEIVNQHNAVMEQWKVQSKATLSDGELQQLNVYVCCVHDLASILWSGCATFDEDDTGRSRPYTLLFSEIREAIKQRLQAASVCSSVRTFSIASALSITHGAIFSDYVVDFLRTHAANSSFGETGDDMFITLQGQRKLSYLEYLKSRGLTGLYELLITFPDSQP